MSPTGVLAPRVGERPAPGSAVAPKPVATSPALRPASGAKITAGGPEAASGAVTVLGGMGGSGGKGAEGWGKRRGSRAEPRCPGPRR